jgi:uncharacterized protein (TIGR02001 family)
MKKLILVTAIGAIFTSGIALAEEKKPDNEYTFNVGAASEYRYRGISQSRFEPALQGGADYTNNPTGLYAGTWLSTIKWLKDAGTMNGYDGKGDVEVDLYGGKKGDIGKGIGYDVGGLYYWYPENNYDKVGENANTFELYGKLTYGPAYVKYSHALTNLFGNPDSKNSFYLDAGADIELGGGYILNLHAGHQHVANLHVASYNDVKLGITKQFYGVDFSLAAIATDADKDFYVTPSGKFTGRTAAVLTATKTF